jgi:hypothetical protein
MTFSVFLNNFIKDYNWSPLYENIDDGYFKGITTAGTEYWEVHTQGLELADIDSKDKDTTEILDLGTWFGVLPYAMSQYGFKNIDTTECLAHSVGQREIFEKHLWPNFNLNPYELHILPGKEFTLPKQYDIIMCFRSNVFWKTQEVIHHTPGSVIANDIWELEDKDGKKHTFFTVYNKHEWEFFINNIRKYLKPGGKAIIQPSPYAYDLISGYQDEFEYLKPFTHPGPVYDKASGHQAFYVVIEA